MSSAADLILMVGGLHILALVGAFLLILPALRDPELPRDLGGGSDGGGGLHRPSPGNPVKPSGGLPLPDAELSRIRLREPGRLADHRPRPERRPAREPGRPPVRA